LEGALRIGKMMDREPRDHAVELRVPERQVFGVAGSERDIAQPGFGATRLGLFQHLFRGIESDNRTCPWRQRRRNDARSAGDVEQFAATRIA
jgi:hypothetical protein